MQSAALREEARREDDELAVTTCNDRDAPRTWEREPAELAEHSDVVSVCAPAGWQSHGLQADVTDTYIIIIGFLLRCSTAENKRIPTPL